MENEEKFQAIIITHIKLSALKHVNPKSFTRQLEKSIKLDKPGEFHGGKVISNKNSVHFSIPIDNSPLENGKIPRYFIPKAGIQIILDDSVFEKANNLAKSRHKNKIK